MNFAARPPSASWEPVTLPQAPACVVWVWYRPPAAPSDVVVQIPPPTLAGGGPLSVRGLLGLVGLECETAVSWTILGNTFAVQGGSNPLLDQPLPPGVTEVAIQTRAVPAPASPPVTMPPASASPMSPMPTSPTPMLPTPMSPAPLPMSVPGTEPDPHSLRMLQLFKADWQTLLTLETQLSAVRKQLGAVQGQLQSLNRDLNPDERLVADNQDKKDWQDARRWLRDSLAVVSRWIRDHDIGMVSAAGNRNRFEQIHQDYVVPMQTFPGLAAASQEFEQHRKTAQNLLVQMQSAHQNASRDGVNRARQVLSRIAAKVSKAREKRGTR